MAKLTKVEVSMNDTEMIDKFITETGANLAYKSIEGALLLQDSNRRVIKQILAEGDKVTLVYDHDTNQLDINI